ncbi:MAG: thioredoxin fold domain-containing protein [Aquificae bacterium]|nr:thioredoxin fold domain-containing protein [Aquificota bacterium]
MRKTLKILLLILIFGVFTGAQTWLNDLKEAERIAKKENKLILIYVYSEHCPYCHQVEEFVFGDERVEKFLKRNFIVVSADVKDELSRRFGVFGTPSFLVYDPLSGRVVGRLFGSLDAESFLKALESVCNKTNVRRC